MIMLIIMLIILIIETFSLPYIQSHNVAKTKKFEQ